MNYPRITILSLVLVSLAATAHAQDARDRAIELVREGFAETQDGNFDEAERLMERAYELYPRPAILFNLADLQARRPNNCRRTRAAFLRFLDACDGCENEASGRARLARLERRCRVEVTVTSTPRGAAVRVGADYRGTTPLTFESLPGLVPVKLELDGYEELEETLTVVEASPLRVDLSLRALEKVGTLRLTNVRDGVEVSVDAQPVGTAALSGVTLPVGLHRVELTTRTGRGYAKLVEVRHASLTDVNVGAELERFLANEETTVAPHVVFWTSGGVGVAALGTAIGFAVARNSTLTKRDATQVPSERSALARTADRQGLVTTVGFATAGTALAIATTAWLWPALTDDGAPLYW
ncbi:MAG: PEGA domain-containing protein [Deltaproteobacteria bacterium]